MTQAPAIVLVALATGKQGSSIIRALISRPVPPTRIYALTRSPTGPAALALAALSPTISLLQGTATSLPSLTDLGLTSACLITEWISGGPEGERRQATAFLTAVAEAGVSHVVFSSAAAGPGSGVAHFESKVRIEEAIKATGLDWTILKPATFMENFPKKSGAATFALFGLFEAVLKGRKIQYVACQDIGYFGAQALLDPAGYKGRTIALAGDDLSVDDIQDAYGHNQGGARPWRMFIPSFVLRCLPAPVRALFAYMTLTRDTVDVEVADIAALRKEHPGLLTLKQWLKTE